MTTVASQITSFTVVYSTVYSDTDQRKHQSSASLAFVRGIHRDRWIPRTKGQLRGKCFHLMTSSCNQLNADTACPQLQKQLLFNYGRFYSFMSWIVSKKINIMTSSDYLNSMHAIQFSKLALFFYNSVNRLNGLYVGLLMTGSKRHPHLDFHSWINYASFKVSVGEFVLNFHSKYLNHTLKYIQIWFLHTLRKK